MTMKHDLEADRKSAYHDAIEKIHDAKLAALRKRLAASSITGEKVALKKRIALEIQDHKTKVAELSGILF